MAYGSNPGNDSDYSDAAPAPAQDQPMEKEGDKEESETALLPESILMGKKFDVGEEVIFKIVAKHDGQIEVAYATEEPHEGTEEEAHGESAPAPQGGGDEMGQMMY